MTGRWDIIIGHPPCTYLTNASAVRMRVNGEIVPERYAKAMEAKNFFLSILNADCDHVAVENPVPLKLVDLPPYSQIIQPYMFGHPYTKKTCLWLKGLDPLVPTEICELRHPYVCGNAEIWKKQAAQGVVYGKEKDAKHRSKTFTGIAKAMADQWG